jgi:large subunit ribosomal protein L9
MHCSALEDQNAMDKLIGMFADRLADRAFQERTPDQAQLDRATLAKPGSAVVARSPSLGKALPPRSTLVQPMARSIYMTPSTYRPPRPLVLIPFATTADEAKAEEVEAGEVVAVDEMPTARPKTKEEMDAEIEEEARAKRDAMIKKMAADQAKKDMAEKMKSSRAAAKSNMLMWGRGVKKAKGKKSVAAQKAEADEAQKERASKVKSEEVVGSLQGKTFTTVLAWKMNKKGKVSAEVDKDDIAKAVKDEAGITIDEKEVDIPKPFKSTGEFDVSLNLKGGVAATIKLKIEAEKE